MFRALDTLLKQKMFKLGSFGIKPSGMDNHPMVQLLSLELRHISHTERAEGALACKVLPTICRGIRSTWCVNS